METKFELNLSDIASIMQQARSGSIRVRIKVNGYWSQDSINVSCSHMFKPGIDGWEIEVNHSTGGRDTNEIKDNLEASRNFAMALNAAVDFAETLKVRLPEFEAARQEGLIQWEKTEEEEKAKRQAELDADPAVTEKQAEELISQLKGDRNGTIHVRARCSDRVTFIEAKSYMDTFKMIHTMNIDTWGQKHGSSLTLKQAKELLLQSSAKTTFEAA